MINPHYSSPPGIPFSAAFIRITFKAPKGGCVNAEKDHGIKVNNIKSLLRTLVLVGCVFGSQISYAEPQQKDAELSGFHAVILGVVEGITEYLPVSSTGHLLLTKEILKLGRDTENGDAENRQDTALNAYLVCIQFGAILAILFVCANRFKKITQGIFFKDPEGRRMLTNLIIAISPAILAGLLLEGLIKQYLFGVNPVIAGWAFGGVFIIVISYYFKMAGRKLNTGTALEDLAVRQALVIGIAQCIAMWPGISRSLATILGGIFAGLSMAAAVEFSFLLGALTLTAATAYDILKHGSLMLAEIKLIPMLIGLLFAFLTAVVSVKWMIRYLSRYGLELFGYYRITIAAIAFLIYGK